MPSFAEVVKVNAAENQNPDTIYVRNVAVKAAVGVVTYPISMVKTLAQLGFEPYPLDSGKTFIFFGRDAYFLPNFLRYARNIYKEHGLKALFRGVEAGIVGTFVGGISSYYVLKYLDEHYPDLGGKPENVGVDENQLSDYNSFRVHLRLGLRETVSKVAGLIISHPFSVIMIREIAQHIGGECKYPNVLCSLLRVGDEEGPRGLFSGLIPMLVAELVVLWGVRSLTYASERLFLKLEKQDDESRETIQQVRKATPFLIPLVVQPFAYPFNVVSTVVAVAGSHLAISLLPYSPLFSHWGDAYSYLKPHGLTRGARTVLREHKGAVSIGADHHIYASNKYFL